MGRICEKMRRSAWMIAFMCIMGIVQCWSASLGSLFGSRDGPKPNVIPLTEDMLKDNLELWLKDYAVMFYSDWCPHCKRFSPVWEQIAADVVTPRGRKHKEDIVVGKFNCEQSDEAIKFCVSVGVTHYPTFMVFGYGNYYDRGLLRSIFGGRNKQVDKVVKYNGLIYYEALRDWVHTMHSISWVYRMEDKLKGWLGLKRAKDPMPMLMDLKKENRMLRETNAYLTEVASEASLYGGYRSATAVGDPFYELAAVDYDEKYLPVLACVVDVLGEYCPTAKGENYCAILEDCIDKEFEPQACRPDSCPLEDEGCELISACLEDDVLKTYIELYSQSAEESGSSDDKKLDADEDGSKTTKAEATGEGDSGEQSSKTAKAKATSR